MLGYYNYTVVLTYLGMLSAFAGITYVMNGNIHTALICLMFAGLFDMFDGKVASTKKSRTDREKKFGIQIDSLSDLISFGALPAIMLYALCEGRTAGTCVAGLYLLCALIRLAFFNVDEEERQSKTQEARKFYLGLPVTTSALILPTFMQVGTRFALPLDVVATITLLAMSIAFVTPFQLKKPGNAGKAIMTVFGITLLCVMFMGGN